MKSKYIILVIAFLLIAVAVSFYLYSGDNVDTGFFASPTPQPTPIPPIYSPVPAGVKVPEAGEKSTNHDIAIPIAVAPSKTSTEAKIRTFAIKASNNVFDPNTVIANVGDTVRIKLTAVDKAYDLTIEKLDLTVSAKKGETKTLEFQAPVEGNYLFYCDLCGGQNSSTNGHIIIAPKGSN